MSTYSKEQKIITKLKPKVLLLEKNLYECKVIADAIKNQYEISTCTTANEFIELLISFQPDAVILNDVLAKENRRAHLLDYIKAANTTQHIKASIIKDSNHTTHAKTRHVADGYFTKSLTSNNLIKWLDLVTANKRNDVVIWGR